MKPNHLLKTGLALLILALMAFTIQSFTNRNEKKAATSYFYVSSDTTAGAYSDPNNWSTSGSGGCSDGNAPCMINVPENVTLEDHIGGLSNSQVLAICETRKNL